MSVLTVVLYVCVIIVALLLVALILVQRSKGGGFGSSFGGVGESVFGAHAGSHLTKATVWLTAAFFALTLLLAMMLGWNHGSSAKIEVNKELVAREKAEAAKAMEAAKTAAKAPAAPVKAPAQVPAKAPAK